MRVDLARLAIAGRASENKHRNETQSVVTNRVMLEKRLREVQDEQDALTRRKGTPEDVYARNMASLHNEQVEIEAQLSRADAEPESQKITFEQVFGVFKDANNMAFAFLAADDDRKRSLAESVLSNLSIRDKKVQDFRLKEPFMSIASLPKNPTIAQLRRGRDSNPRCHF